MPNPVLQPQEKASKSDLKSRGGRVSHAYSQLRELIIWGKLAPGTRIIETEIASRLGVSRTPVRSALHRLQQEGYIIEAEAGVQSRLIVAPLTREDARELFMLVAELEALAAGYASDLPEETRRQAVESLRAANASLAEAAARPPRPDPNQIFEFDQAFHNLLVRSGAGPRVRALYDSVKPQTERYVRLYISALLNEIGTSVREHAAVIETLAAGDVEATRSRVREHWRNSTDRMYQVIESVGERGTW